QRRDHVSRGREAAEHRRLVAGRRGRLRGAGGLGIRAAIRFRAGVRRVSDSNHQGLASMSADRIRGWLMAAVCAAAAGCGRAETMDRLAERYVKLVLAVGQHDADYVDAYYGPPEWRKEAEASKRPIPDIDRDAADLLKQVAARAPGEDAE